MVDTVRANNTTVAGGPLFAVDNISGSTYATTKLTLGAGDVDDGYVHSSNPLPVTAPGVVSTYAVNAAGGQTSSWIAGQDVPVSTYSVGGSLTPAGVQSTFTVNGGGNTTTYIDGQNGPVSTFAVNSAAPAGVQSTFAVAGSAKTSTHIASQTGPVSTFAVNAAAPAGVQSTYTVNGTPGSSSFITGQSSPVSTYTVNGAGQSSTFITGQSGPVSTYIVSVPVGSAQLSTKSGFNQTTASLIMMGALSDYAVASTGVVTGSTQPLYTDSTGALVVRDLSAAASVANPNSSFIMGSAAGSAPVSTYTVNGAGQSSTWITGQDAPVSTYIVGQPISTYARADNFISANNSWTATTAASSTWTASGDDVSNYNAVTVQLATDQDSAASGMTFQFSNDNTNWDDIYKFTMDVSASSTRRFQFPVSAQYFRNVYTNGGTNQGYFRVQTIYHSAAPGTSIHRLGDDASPDRSASVVKAALLAQAAGSGNFIPIDATVGGNLKVAVEEWDATAVISTFAVATQAKTSTHIAGQTGPVSTFVVGNVVSSAVISTFSVAGSAKTSTHIASQTGPVSTFAVNNPTSSGTMSTYVVAASAKTSTHIAGQTGPVSTFSVGGTASTVPVPASTGGLSAAAVVSLTTAAFQIKNGPTQLHSVWFTNSAGTLRWLKFYDAGAVTVGTTPPNFYIGLPPNSTTGWMPPGSFGIQFNTSCFVAATTGQATTDATAPSTNDVLASFFYK